MLCVACLSSCCGCPPDVSEAVPDGIGVREKRVLVTLARRSGRAVAAVRSCTDGGVPSEHSPKRWHCHTSSGTGRNLHVVNVALLTTNPVWLPSLTNGAKLCAL